MSEPITLYKDGATVTVYAPSVALDLQAQGWTSDPQDDGDDVPFDFAPVAEDEPEADIVPVKAKRGRPRKATA
jgi:hypothetical protein